LQEPQRGAEYRNVSSLPSTTSCTQSMATATLIIYSLPKLGISRTIVPGGDSSACHPCRHYSVLTADAIRSYCCLLLPRGLSKSLVKKEKTGWGGGLETRNVLEIKEFCGTPWPSKVLKRKEEIVRDAPLMPPKSWRIMCFTKRERD
jgi:hypothetical protein